ncbi:hypothetical protein K2173_002399 [Erythroxylum novogranatense]|uniref:Phototropic-responsive NPH3 family protein n=1 Tax=Erythroxylum novogranatense TaxID=1862640 RepID=A0AAV8TB14_9ROSI|nr:hypothetical protein K2173_002399 [Erythroxylum novogranatense]
MKFMKLGSKPDTFQTDGNRARYVASELATDIVVNIGDVKFYLHKFPLLSKSIRLQKMVTTATNAGNCDEVDISDIPGGPAAFETCAKFCYAMTVTLNAYNVVAVRCAAEYLEMHEMIEKGNLACKIDVFLNSSIFCSWKDSIIVLKTTKSLLPLSEELKVTSHCIDAIATKACIDITKVDWSFTYNRKKLPKENGNDPTLNGTRIQSAPKDWWVEDLCELEIDLYKRVIATIRTKNTLCNAVIGEALKAYAYRRLPGLSKSMIQSEELVKYRSIVDTIMGLLPGERGTVSCNFLLKLLKAATFVKTGDVMKGQLIRRIGQQLEEASVHDLLLQAGQEENVIYDVDTVKKIVEAFLMRDQNHAIDSSEEGHQIQEAIKPGILSDASKLMVGKLIDGYLAEIAKDPNLPLLNFVELADMVAGMPRPAHDAIYRAIDMYLKEHPGISKSEMKRICKLMDCKKLSVDACLHAVQNERLPLRVVVQVVFSEQLRVSALSGSNTRDLPQGIRHLNNASQRSSISVTPNQEEDWEAVATAEGLKALKKEIASFRLSDTERNGADGRISVDKAISSKMRGLLKSKKILTKLWSSKGEHSGSYSSASLGSANL